MEVRLQKSGVSESVERGLFAVKDIPWGVMIALEEGTKVFYVLPLTWMVLDLVYCWMRMVILMGLRRIGGNEVFH